jgi:hypothetical protein
MIIVLSLTANAECSLLQWRMAHFLFRVSASSFVLTPSSVQNLPYTTDRLMVSNFHQSKRISYNYLLSKLVLETYTYRTVLDVS